MNDEINPVEATGSDATGETQAQVQETPEVVTATKGKNAKTGNVILDIAAEVEGLTKPKALHLADKLVDTIETDYFRLGGVLKVIYENAWFEGYPTFAAFVSDKFGFAERKAKYLMEIYDALVTKLIPWEKVSGLGWTKLKDLARHLTPENVDEWVAKAQNLTVSELQALLKGNDGEGDSTTKTTDDVTKISFKLKHDQAETVTSALNKAKAEAGTEFDNVALEMICVGYLGGSSGISANVSIIDQMKTLGWEGVLGVFEQAFPNVNLAVEPPTA